MATECDWRGSGRGEGEGEEDSAASESMAVTIASARSGHGPVGSRASGALARVDRKSTACRSTSPCSGRTVNRCLPAATKQSSKAWATRTAGSSPMILAAPFSEWAARIIDSMVAGDRSNSSTAKIPEDKTAVWISASSRNSSSIENPLRSSATLRSFPASHFFRAMPYEATSVLRPSKILASSSMPTVLSSALKSIRQNRALD